MMSVAGKVGIPIQLLFNTISTRQAGAAPVITEVTQKMNERAQSSGLGNRDTSEMWKLWRELPVTLTTRL